MNGVLNKYPVYHPILKKYIKFFWEIEADFMQLNHNIIPVRNIDLKFNLSEPPHYLQVNDKSHLLERVYFSGLQDHFRNARIVMRGKVHVLGICFFPASFYPFIKIPLAECKNQLLGAWEAGLFSIKTIHEKLMKAPDITSRIDILEHELISELDNKIQTPDSFSRIFYSLKQCDASMTVSEFCQSNNLGMRKLERMFNKYVGVSTKTYGFLDAEIAEEMKEESWCIIFRYENFEKVQAIGTQLRGSKEFADFTSLIVSESLKISFCQQIKRW